jgi:hypothetical protein
MEQVYADMDWEAWTDTLGFTLVVETANTSE